MTVSFPLLKRKLRPPAVPESFVRRESLLTQLLAGQQANIKLTLVCAGPGYGKSTTVADYVRQSARPSCWLNLDPLDADLSTFLNYFVRGVTEACLDGASQAAELLAAVPSLSGIAANLMGVFAEELGDRLDSPVILVLDDFHAVQDSEPVCKAMEAFLAYLPENVQLIVISRSQLPMRLPQLKVRQQLVELGIPDLRFNPDEVSELVRSVSGRAIAPDQARALFHSTEGWAASLVLAAQQSGLLPELAQERDALFEYLAQEVFADLPQGTQDFLLWTSLLNAVDPDVCRQVLGFEQAEAIVQQLRRTNLLLTRGDGLEGYYHPIFQAFLQAKLTERFGPAAVAERRGSLADFLKPHEPEEALNLYLEGMHYPKAIALLKEMAPGYLALFRLDTLRRFLDRFPEEVRNASSWLLLYSGEVLRQSGEPDLAIARLERAERLAKEQQDPLAEGRALSYQAAFWGARGDERLREFSERALFVLPENDAAGRAFAYNALGLFHQMSNQAQPACEAFESALESFQKAEDMLGQSKVLHNLGLVFARQGDFKRAASTYQESVHQAERGGRRAYPATYNNLAAIHHSLGAFELAWTTAEQGLSLAQQLGAKRDEHWTVLTLGMIACSLGQHAKAADLFQRARDAAIASGDRPLEAQSLSGQADLARSQGQLERAHELLAQAIALRGLPIEAPAMVDLQIPLAQIALDQGQVIRAAEVLALARETLETQGFRYRLAQVLFLQARVLRVQGDEKAHARWEEARKLCEANDYSFLLSQEPWTEEATKAAPQAQSVMASRLKIRCFGTFEAASDEGLIATKSWQGTKTKLVLAFLLHHPQGVTREQLAQALYGEEEVSRSAILMIISRLRQALESDLAKNAPSRYVQWNDGRYYFNFGAPYQLDVQEFEFHLQQAKADGMTAKQQIVELEKALELYRGRYLRDLDESLWVQSTQEHFHQRALAGFQRILELHEEAGDAESMLGWADKGIAIDNCAEFAHRAKMKALMQLGNRQGALRHFQQLKEILDLELGVSPSAESQRLYEQIMAGAR